MSLFHYFLFIEFNEIIYITLSVLAFIMLLKMLYIIISSNMLL